MKIIDRTRSAWIAAAVVMASLAGQPAGAQERGTPRPEVQKLVQALVGAVNGAAPAVDSLVKDHFTSDYRAARTLEERRTWFEPIRARFGKISVSELRRRADDTFVIVASGERNGTLHLVVTHDDRFQIQGLALEEPGAGG